MKNSSETDAKVVSYNQNLYMAKLDVESLLTSIRLKETIKNCVNDLISNNFYSGKLTRKGLHDLLKLATNESSLTWLHLWFI